MFFSWLGAGDFSGAVLQVPVFHLFLGVISPVSPLEFCWGCFVPCKGAFTSLGRALVLLECWFWDLVGRGELRDSFQAGRNPGQLHPRAAGWESERSKGWEQPRCPWLSSAGECFCEFFSSAAGKSIKSLIFPQKWIHPVPIPPAVRKGSGWRGKTPQKMRIKQQSGCGFDIHWCFQKGLKNPLWMNFWRGVHRPSCCNPGAVFSLLDPLGKNFRKPKWKRRIFFVVVIPEGM